MAYGANFLIYTLNTFENDSPDNLNKHALAYPTEVGSLSFGLPTVKDEKDISYRAAIDNGRRELAKLKSIADLVYAQAEATMRQLEIAEAVNKAERNFSPRMGGEYWLVEISRESRTILCHLGPTEWSLGAPEGYRYLGKVRQLPTGLWESIDP